MAEGGGSPPRPDPRRRNVPSEEDDDDDFVSSSVTRDHYKKLRNEYIQCKHVIANATALLICITTSIFFSSVLEDSFLYMMSLIALLLVVVSFVLEVIIKTDFIKCPLTNTFFMMVWILDLGCGLISLVMCVVCLILAYDEYNELMKQEYSIFFAKNLSILMIKIYTGWRNINVIRRLAKYVEDERKNRVRYAIDRRCRLKYFGTTEFIDPFKPRPCHLSDSRYDHNNRLNYDYVPLEILNSSGARSSSPPLEEMRRFRNVNYVPLNTQEIDDLNEALNSPQEPRRVNQSDDQSPLLVSSPELSPTDEQRWRESGAIPKSRREPTYVNVDPTSCSRSRSMGAVASSSSNYTTVMNHPYANLPPPHEPADNQSSQINDQIRNQSQSCEFPSMPFANGNASEKADSKSSRDSTCGAAGIPPQDRNVSIDTPQQTTHESTGLPVATGNSSDNGFDSAAHASLDSVSEMTSKEFPEEMAAGALPQTCDLIPDTPEEKTDESSRMAQAATTGISSEDGFYSAPHSSGDTLSGLKLAEFPEEIDVNTLPQDRLLLNTSQETTDEPLRPTTRIAISSDDGFYSAGHSSGDTLAGLKSTEFSEEIRTQSNEPVLRPSTNTPPKHKRTSSVDITKMNILPKNEELPYTRTSSADGRVEQSSRQGSCSPEERSPKSKSGTPTSKQVSPCSKPASPAQRQLDPNAYSRTPPKKYSPNSKHATPSPKKSKRSSKTGSPSSKPNSPSSKKSSSPKS